MTTTRIRSQFTVRDTDPLVNAHRVQDIHILPGVAMLDAVYKTLQAQRMDLSALALRGILFHEPIVTNAQIDRKVTVTVDMRGAEGRIAVTSLPWKIDRPLATDPTTHMTCLLTQGEPFASTPPPACAKPLPAEAVDLDACYSVTRHIGIFHDGFMKCSGRVAVLPSGQHLGEVTLGPDAASRAADFLLHPVFLDCSTIVPLFPLHDRLDQASLFIPFAIDEFQAVALTGQRDVRVLVEPLDTEAGGHELLRYSFRIFDRQGRQLVAVRHFTVKKVRSLQNIRRLLERSLTLPPAGGSHSNQLVASGFRLRADTDAVALRRTAVALAEAVSRKECVPAAAGDAISDLIGTLLGRHGNFVWNPDHARKPFFELGLDSLALLDAAEALERQLGVRLYPTALFENPDVAALTAHLRAAFPDACAEYARRTGETESTRMTRSAGASASASAASNGEPILELIASLVRPHLAGDWKPESAETSFFDLGLDSIVLLDLADTLEQRLGVRLYPTVLFERPTPAALASYLREEFSDACARYGAQFRVAPAVTSTPTVVPVPAQRLEVMVPRWFPARPEYIPSSAQAIALLGDEEPTLSERLNAELGNRVSFQGGVPEFTAALEAGLICDEVCLVAVDHDCAFAVVKALMHANRLRAPLTVRAITLDCFRVHDESPRAEAAHGVWGLLQSLSREYPQVTVSQIDLSSNEVTSEASDWVALAMAVTPTRTLRAIRSGRAYRRLLSPVSSTNDSRPHFSFRRGGTYLVVGGASGVGLEFVRHLRRNYAAKVAVVGRRPEGPEIVRTLAAEGEYGRDLLYLSAAVDDEAALTQAIQTARAQLGELHGVVHSAMVLEDSRLAEMDEAAFARVLQPKVAGALTLARATAALELDFVLFFSSAQSFVGNIGQANYAAASTFLDGFAGALRAYCSYPVVVVNWGFWSEVGAVASERYRQLMARQGVHGLKSAEALAALEDVLASGWEQAAIVAAEESVLEEMGLDRAVRVERAPIALPAVAEPPVTSVAAEDARMFAETEAAMARLLEVTRGRVGQIVKDLLAGRSVDEALASGAVASQHARLVRALLTLTGRASFEGQKENCIWPNVLHSLPCADLWPYAGGCMADDDLWETHADWWIDGFTAGADPEYEEQILPLAATELQGARRVLDVGCGDGQVSRLAASLGSDLVVGVDPTWNQVSVAHQRGGGASFAKAGAGALPFADESFDAVVACLVFEHIRDVDDAIAEVARVLVPGGRFCFFLNHPLLQTPNSGWIDDQVLDPPEQYWRIGPYLIEDETIEEVEKDVFIPFIHRPLSRYVNALARNGLLLQRMDEPAPPAGFLAKAEEYAAASTIPRLLYLRTAKLQPVKSAP